MPVYLFLRHQVLTDWTRELHVLYTYKFSVYLETQGPAEDGPPPLHLPPVGPVSGHRDVQEVYPTHPLIVPLDKVWAGDLDLAPRLLGEPANGSIR